MAATAQDASAPLRGPDKKDEDRDEDSKQPSPATPAAIYLPSPVAADRQQRSSSRQLTRLTLLLDVQLSTLPSLALKRELFFKKLEYSTNPTSMHASANRCSVHLLLKN